MGEGGGLLLIANVGEALICNVYCLKRTSARHRFKKKNDEMILFSTDNRLLVVFFRSDCCQRLYNLNVRAITENPTFGPKLTRKVLNVPMEGGGGSLV